LKRVAWTGEPFVLQWGHGHTGDGTILVNSQAELDKWKARFPYRMTRMSALIIGPSFTVNALVAGDDVLIGNVSYQITGMAPFTDSRFATVGNDWSAVRSVLTEAELRSVENLAKDIGMRLKDSGWRGLYGVDIMRDDERGRIFLIEVNARQPASTPFESFLQLSERAHACRQAGKVATGLTMFEAHLKALLGEAITEPLIKIKDGSQIIQRVTNTMKSVPASAASSLESAGYQVVSYANTELNADLLRIQSMNGIMAGHNEFNDKGKEIVKIVSNK
jgi:formate-dependent phosphoribosylglycinamide formyltransferase (GAR transformylase)